MRRERRQAAGHAWPLWWLIGLSVAVRLAVWAALPDRWEGRTGADVDLYKIALRHHFWEYLVFEHTEPVGLNLLHAGVLALFGDAGFSNAVMLAPAMAAGVLTAIFTYATARRLGAPAALAVSVCAVYSLGLVPFEVWWRGWTLDHYTLGLVAFFAWALTGWVQDGRLRWSVLTAVAGGLLLLIQKVACVVVPTMVVAVAILLQPGRLSRVRRMAIALSGPLLVSAVLIGKNALAHGIFATSSLAGPNLAVFLYAAKGYDYDAVDAFAKQWNAPEWYRWCFQRARVHEASLGPSYGSCFVPEDPTQGPYDFEPLIRQAASLGEVRLAQLVESDQQLFVERPYLQSFLAREVTPRFSAVYGSISQRLYRTLAWREPLVFIRQVVRSHYLYLVDGWRFLAFLARDQAGLPYRGLLLVGAAGCFLLFMQGYLAAYLLGIRLLLVRWRRRNGSFGDVDRGLAVMVIGTATASGVLSLVCCENGRWFLQCTPYLVPLVAFVFHHVVWPAPAALPVDAGRRAVRGRP